MKPILLGLLLCWSWTALLAQHKFSGVVTDENNETLPGAQVMLSRGDSIYAASLTDRDGKFSIKRIETGSYDLEISFPGYTPLEEKRTIEGDQSYRFSLVPEIRVELGNVEVTGNRADRVERTATGQIFRLSEKARNSGDPFRALREIPRLISDEANRTVQMSDGSKPLVLIDGIAVNSGITPIDPKDIESVEVVDVVSARYLRTGAKHILNIKLKKKRDPYRFFEAMDRFDFPDRKETSALYFEVGNDTYSLYGRGAFEYTWHDDREVDSWQRGDGYFKRSLYESLSDKRMGLGELLFKWKATPKDYLAFHIYGKGNRTGNGTEGQGTWETDRSEDFTYRDHSDDKSDVLTGSLYHKHDFSEAQMLETTLAFNRNWNTTDGERQERYPDWSYLNLYRFENNRTSAILNLDYSWTLNPTHSLNLGSETRYLNDHIDQVTDAAPVFLHREWSEYLYATFTGQLKRLSYMLSAGMEGFRLKAGGEPAGYVRPRASVGTTLSLTDNQSLQLDYKLTNRSPEVGQLNPYNTSTDSLVMTVGNPGLTPMQIHSLGATYTLNYKGLYVSPYVNGTFYTDAIEPYGYTRDGIYVNTYRNQGSFKDLSAGGQLSLRLGNVGNMYVMASHNVNYYEGQEARKFFTGGAGLSLTYRRWLFNTDVYYQNYAFTALSRTRYHAPTYSCVQVNYTIFPGFYVAVALQNMNAPLRTEVLTVGEGYRSYSSVREQDQSWRPWLLVRYTFRKNVKQKIKLGNVVRSKEKGIELMK